MTLEPIPAALPLQFGVPGGPELAILALLLAVPLLAGALAYRTGRAAGDDDAAMWAVVVAGLTLAGLIPGLVALFVYSYYRPARREGARSTP